MSITQLQNMTECMGCMMQKPTHPPRDSSIFSGDTGHKEAPSREFNGLKRATAGSSSLRDKVAELLRRHSAEDIHDAVAYVEAEERARNRAESREWSTSLSDRHFDRDGGPRGLAGPGGVGLAGPAASGGCGPGAGGGGCG